MCHCAQDSGNMEEYLNFALSSLVLFWLKGVLTFLTTRTYRFLVMTHTVVQTVFLLLCEKRTGYYVEAW